MRITEYHVQKKHTATGIIHNSSLYSRSSLAVETTKYVCDIDTTPAGSGVQKKFCIFLNFSDFLNF